MACFFPPLDYIVLDDTALSTLYCSHNMFHRKKKRSGGDGTTAEKEIAVSWPTDGVDQAAKRQDAATVLRVFSETL